MLVFSQNILIVRMLEFDKDYIDKKVRLFRKILTMCKSIQGKTNMTFSLNQDYFAPIILTKKVLYGLQSV